MLNLESVLSGIMGDTMLALGKVVTTSIAAETGFEFERLSLGSTGHEQPMFNGEFVNMFIEPSFHEGTLVGYDIKCTGVPGFPELLELPVFEGDSITAAFEQYIVSKLAYNLYHDDILHETAYNK